MLLPPLIAGSPELSSPSASSRNGANKTWARLAATGQIPQSVFPIARESPVLPAVIQVLLLLVELAVVEMKRLFQGPFEDKMMSFQLHLFIAWGYKKL